MDEVIARYRDLGHDFLAITDHDDRIGEDYWFRIPRGDERMLVLGGIELDYRPLSQHVGKIVGDRETLEDIAATTGGSALGPVDELPARLKMDPPRIVRVDRRTDIELWSRPGLLFLIVGLLGLEWLLRQRSGYL